MYKRQGYETGLYPSSPYYAVKVPVFSFEKLSDVDTQLGPEMKSTGEVLGIAGTMEEALYKGMIAAGYYMKRNGGILISVRDTDKKDLKELAKAYVSMGFTIYATAVSYTHLFTWASNSYSAAQSSKPGVSPVRPLFLHPNKHAYKSF